jgi:hypothetical protein
MKSKDIWLLGVGLLVAGAAALWVIKNSTDDDDEKPPKSAPQLDVENPGTQDDFPKPPIESDLG